MAGDARASYAIAVRPSRNTSSSPELSSLFHTDIGGALGWHSQEPAVVRHLH